jgi:hypothetical protein
MDAVVLRALFGYDAETGLLTRLVSCAGKKAGTVAGTRHAHGYVSITIGRKHYLAHRLAWLYAHGCWPAGDIDHLNGVKDDNGISSLRDVTKTINQQNQRRPQKSRTFGLLGARWHAGAKAWRARIQVDGQERYLGLFQTAEQAHEAYLNAKRALHAGNTL